MAACEAAVKPPAALLASWLWLYTCRGHGAGGVLHDKLNANWHVALVPFSGQWKSLCIMYDIMTMAIKKQGQRTWTVGQRTRSKKCDLAQNSSSNFRVFSCLNDRYGPG